MYKNGGWGRRKENALKSCERKKSQQMCELLFFFFFMKIQSPTQTLIPAQLLPKRKQKLWKIN